MRACILFIFASLVPSTVCVMWYILSESWLNPSVTERKKNTQQKKEQGKNTPDLTNEEEIGSLPEKEFRIMTVKMIQNLGNRIDKMQETFNK